MTTILICNDDRNITAALAVYLKAEGYAVRTASNGREAVETVRTTPVQLVLMDIMMPVMDGVTAMAQIRETSNVPVILLTAKGEDSDKILGLNVGADDYITKPFNPVEVVARVRSQLRRYLQLGADTRAARLAIGSITLDDRRKEVRRDGELIGLTPTEYEILKLLMARCGEVIAPREIYRQVWHAEPYGAEATVAVHIRHLREKLELNPAEPRYLKVVWAQGYKFEDCERDAMT